MLLSRRSLVLSIPFFATAACLPAASPDGNPAAGDPGLADALHARIVKERNAICAVPFRRLVNGSESVEAARQLRAGADPSTTLEDLLAAMKRHDRLTAIGWALEADSVDALVLPPAVLKPSTYALMIVAVAGRHPVEALLAMIA